MKKCRNCGVKIIEYPIYKGQELGEKFEFNKINWYNLLIGDWTKLLFIICILLVAFSYAHDTKECRNIITTMSNLTNVCKTVCLNQVNPIEESSLFLNFSNDLNVNG